MRGVLVDDYVFEVCLSVVCCGETLKHNTLSIIQTTNTLHIIHKHYQLSCQ